MVFLSVLKTLKALFVAGEEMEIILKPCPMPRCGSHAVVLYKIGRKWVVHCVDCHVRTAAYRRKRSAKRAWNRGSMQ